MLFRSLTALVHSIAEKRKSDWYALSQGKVWINSVGAVAQARLVDPALRVTEKEMVRTLRAMSTGQRQARAVNNKDVKMWELDLSTLKSWCDETQVVDFEIIEEALKKQTAHGEKNGAA